MAKKVILAVIAVVIIAFFALMIFGTDSVDIYIDGENVTVTTNTLSNIDKSSLSRDICDYTLNVMNDTTTDVETYKHGISDICSNYDLENIEINLDSAIGKNQIPVIVYVDGTSMLPTLQDGQKVLLNKTHNIHVGDIVVADSDEYGGIIKRIGEIDGDEVYLVSDNKQVSHEYINGVLYEIKGITTWVNIDDINGVAISY